MTDLNATAIVPSRAPVPGELRVGWRIPLLLMIVDHCWGGKASWTQIHVLSWALLQRKAPEDTARLLRGDTGIGEQVVGIDPAVNRTVDLAVGAGLLTLDGRRVALTDAGRTVLTDTASAEAFAVERDLLAQLPGKVTDRAAQAALGRHS
ncbi:MAG: hypothetical protein JWR63_1679 [Conexibacter sp.]|nr:hypothetical protein [Conexibacter sp.]